MAFKKDITNPVTGKIETGTVLEIVDSHEPMIRLELEDGTLIRAKQSILEVVRMDGKNKEGNDVYTFESSLAVRVTPKEDQKDV